MGNFYTNFTILGASHDKIVQAMKGRTAAISPTMLGFTVVWDAECESQDDKVISSLGQRLAKGLSAPVFAVLNHDDDILMYWLFSPEGKLDEYNSTPGYWDGGDLPPKGGNAALLVKTMAPSAAVPSVERILQNREYVFAFERHNDLTAALAMPSFGATGYKYINRGEVPDGLAEDELTFTR